MTPTDRIRAAVAADRASCPGYYEQTADDIAAAVCEALADHLGSCNASTEILAIAAELRGLSTSQED